jgi:hypothetical protein
MASRKPQAGTRRSTSSGRSRSRSAASTKPTRRHASQPKSTLSTLVDSARSRKGRVVAAAATAATVLGGVALRARRNGSRHLDVRGVVKQIGKASKNVGKTSKQVSEDVHRLGDDIERVGKALS